MSDNEALDQAEAALADAQTALHAATAPRDYTSIVQAWLRETMTNSPVSRSTEAWNYLSTTGVLDLIARLKG